MTHDEFKNLIERRVTEVQGCKATELIVRVADVMGEEFPRHDFIRALTELIEEDRLEEVEYILPSIDYRAKSFLLPKGTQIFLGSSADD